MKQEITLDDFSNWFKDGSKFTLDNDDENVLEFTMIGAQTDVINIYFGNVCFPLGIKHDIDLSEDMLMCYDAFGSPRLILKHREKHDKN